MIDPQIHQDQPVLTAGKRLPEADGVMILVHGRGANARDILQLGGELYHAGLCYLAPQAADNTWYPNRFMDPYEANEPWLSSALAKLAELLKEVTQAGIPMEKVLFAGFSQGACLASEFAVRNAMRYGGLLLFSGGLIGPPGSKWDYPGDFSGMPVFSGCGDQDPYIPVGRVEETKKVLSRMGAAVEQQIYPQMGHTINQDELMRAMEIVQAAMS